MSHHGTKKLEIRNLRRRLVALDSIALVLAWMPAQIWKYTAGMEVWKWLVTEIVLVSSGLALFHFQGLYLARVASSRTEEIRRIVRVSVVLGVVQALMLAVMSVEIQTRWLVSGPLLLVVLLLWFRGGYRAWLSAARASGHHLRDVFVVGVNADASDLVAMLREHPEAGFRVRGVVGDPTLAAVHGLSSLHVGHTDDLLELLHQHDIRGVITVVGALPARELTPMIQMLEDEGIHIQVSNGLHGMSHRRLRATPVAYQSLYYLEPADSSSPQLLVKRWIDLVLASLTVVLAAIPMAIIAIGIKLTDGGPVLFRQKRVGLNGELFHMLKFRSMVVDAEARLAALKEASGNERHGPLFKLERDPRVTRIGQFIRATSLDELPQLFNVLRGDMSIVGPRPALPAEVAQFDDRLLDRLQMPPGITGLWQVEARDNPHFGAYRRLDLFYVDNWSLNLDLVILVATVEQVLSKAVRTLLRRSSLSDSMAQVTPLDSGAAVGASLGANALAPTSADDITPPVDKALRSA
jgi:exopolysaccharide biosynthesis polyprenyl glycosylphosphotransferase